MKKILLTIVFAMVTGATQASLIYDDFEGPALAGWTVNNAVVWGSNGTLTAGYAAFTAGNANWISQNLSSETTDFELDATYAGAMEMNMWDSSEGDGFSIVIANNGMRLYDGSSTSGTELTLTSWTSYNGWKTVEFNRSGDDMIVTVKQADNGTELGSMTYTQADANDSYDILYMKGSNVDGWVHEIEVVPEPATMGMLGLGALAVIFLRRLRA